MLLNKSLITIVLILNVITSYSQPSPSRVYLNIKFSFKNENGNKIVFKKKDSITHKSCKESLTFTMHDIVYTKNDNDSLIVNQNLSNKFYKLGNDKETYILNKKNNTFFIKSLNNVFYNDFQISKSIPILKTNKGVETMIIRFNFSDFKQDVNLKELFISFKKGVYEVTDPENPKLIEITD